MTGAKQAQRHVGHRSHVPSNQLGIVVRAGTVGTRHEDHQGCGAVRDSAHRSLLPHRDLILLGFVDQPLHDTTGRLLAAAACQQLTNAGEFVAVGLELSVHRVSAAA